MRWSATAGCTGTTTSTARARSGSSSTPATRASGYATEAAREVLRIAFEDVRLHRVVGSLEARNTASARVLEKLGMRREAHLIENEWVKGEWQSELIYALLDREWRAAAGSASENHSAIGMKAAPAERAGGKARKAHGGRRRRFVEPAAAVPAAMPRRAA